MKIKQKTSVVLGALMALAMSGAQAGIVVEDDGHHHIKLHIAKGYYIPVEKLEELCHESKEEIEQHAEAFLHKVDGTHDDHDQKVTCDGGHSLETIHDAH